MIQRARNVNTRTHSPLTLPIILAGAEDEQDLNGPRSWSGMPGEE